MKSELVDVSETKKTLFIEIPSDQVDSEIERVTRDIGRTVRIPGFRPGKVPAGRGEAAVPGRDPARGGPRTGAEGGGRGAAGTRRRADCHPRRARRGREGGPAAQVHGVLRNGAPGRSRATTPRSTCGATRRRWSRRRSTRRSSGCASGRRGTSRSTTAASRRATRRRWISSGARSKRTATPGPSEKHENVSLEIGRGGEPARLRRAADRDARGRREDVHGPLPRRLRDRGTAVEGRRVHGEGAGRPPAGRAAARRRPGEGSERRRDAREAARAGARGAAARGAARGRSQAAQRPAEGARGAR